MQTLFAALSHSHAAPNVALSKPASSNAWVDGRWSCSHPNRLELYGNRLLCAQLNNPAPSQPKPVSAFIELLAAPNASANAKGVSSLLATYLGSNSAPSSAAATASTAASASTPASESKSTGAGPCCQAFAELWSKATALLKQCPHSACIQEPVCSVLTVNRVQSVFKNRVYPPNSRSSAQPDSSSASSSSEPEAPGSSDESGADIDAMAARFLACPTLCLDTDYYCSHSDKFTAVHIGDFVLHSPAASPLPSATDPAAEVDKREGPK
jgi:hypothetical protein